MDINIMIFLQAMQFGIAYFFLYRFIFVPAYKILDEQKMVEEKLYYDLEREQSTKDSLQKMYRQRQLACKESLMNMIPIDAQQYQPQKKDTGSTLYHVDSIELSKKIIKETENFLVENLSQVRK